MEKVLEMKGIVKRFPGLVANDHVNFDLYKGEVHALLGENGAGKSTLMSILSGLYQPDEGEIFIRGEKAEITSPHKAIEAGVGMVYQHFMLIQAMTALENIILGLPSEREPWLDLANARKKVVELSQKYNLGIDPDALVEDMSVGEQQRLEIIKTLYRGANILILDEPTAVLTPEESEGIFKVIRKLTSEGISVIFISHKLKEVMEISDRVTILRAGKSVATVKTEETSPEELANMMVGRKVIFTEFPKRKDQKKPVLELKNVCYSSEGSHKQLKDITLTVHAGEVLGIAGVDGNGQSELAKVVTGLLPATKGQILLNQEDMTGKNASYFISKGVAHIPEDRNLMGLVGQMSIVDNIILKKIGEKPFAESKGWRLKHTEIAQYAAGLSQKFDVRGAGLDVNAGSLSGGNQQKIILARELAETPVLLVAVHPSRGLDVGATDFVHHEIIKARDKGAAVLLISGDLDEIMRLSDRIACIYEGEIMGIVDSSYDNMQEIGLMMAGSRLKMRRAN